MNQKSFPTCRVIATGATFEGKQAFTYFSGIAAENTGSTGICMHLLTIPPGQRAKAHLHERHETAIYVIQGKAAMWYGENLQEHLEVKAGEFLYIPAGMPHLPYNPFDEPATAVLARTDPNEQESVVLLPEYDEIHP
ncbi:MAG: cupin domain-containing protein [Anaerolineales bacterium]|nr:cupin domain-containing protein [Anaerolineales bacterium]